MGFPFSSVWFRHARAFEANQETEKKYLDKLQRKRKFFQKFSLFHHTKLLDRQARSKDSKPPLIKRKQKVNKHYKEMS